MSVSRDGRNLALPNADGSFSLWEMAAKRERLRSPSPPGTSIDRFYARDILTFSPDGKLLLIAEESNRLRVRETATGQALPPVVVHDGPVHDVGFSADGKTLAALGTDGTILLWDAARLGRRPAEAQRMLSAQELDSLWADLAAEDAPRAWKAIGALASAPASAVACLKERLTPASPADGGKNARMILDVGSSNFHHRMKAVRELEGLGHVVEPALRLALQATPPLETRRRIEAMLAKLESQILTGAALREVRALEALEHIGTPDARQVLARLAKGAPAALLTREAQAALHRLAKTSISAVSID